MEIAYPTVTALSKWYATNIEFTHCVLETFLGKDYEKNLDNVQDIYAHYSTERTQVEYALSTNSRGRELAESLLSNGYIGKSNISKRYLDIGCAYGGFLVAFAELGYDVCGIEQVELLAQLGRINLRADAVEGQIFEGDFLDSSILSDQPTFDLITCNDVIEHIEDPEQAIKKICRLLAPGGVAYFETVNKRSIKNAYSEIHSGLFGVGLLGHHAADASYKEILNTRDPFQISEFHYLEWYLNIGRKYGVAAEELMLSDVYDYSVELPKFWAEFRDWQQSDRKKLTAYTVFGIEKEVFGYLETFHRALAEAYNFGDIHNFNNKWVHPIIKFIIRK